MNEIVKIITGNRTVRKATNALGFTLVGGLGLALSDGDITWAEVGVAVGASLVTTAAVWKADNRYQNGDPAANQ
jgi:hypothetical protein